MRINSTTYDEEPRDSLLSIIEFNFVYHQSGRTVIHVAMSRGGESRNVDLQLSEPEVSSVLDLVVDILDSRLVI